MGDRRASPSPSPNMARVACLMHWREFFDPSSGIFRSPSSDGHHVEHLDIDLRFVDALDPSAPRESLDLPSVVRVTLRGSEFVQDDEARMDALAEVLMSVKPVELQWLNASDPEDQMTFSTHLVPHEILEAGEHWAAHGSLRKLVIEGGFPCPNLTAPTPFSETPAHTPGHTPGHTPMPSPRLGRSSFALSPMTALDSAAPVVSGQPATPAQTVFTSLGAATAAVPVSPSAGFMLNRYSARPKAIDPAKLAERAERWKAAEFRLKPRLDFAFGNWGASEIRWSLGGRYTNASILTIVESLFKALNSTYPSQSKSYDQPLPSLLTFSPLPLAVLEPLRGLPGKLDLEPKLVEWIQDCVFFTLRSESDSDPAAGVQGESYARLLDIEAPSADRERHARRFKAEAMLLDASGQTKVEIVSQAGLLRSGAARTSITAQPLQCEEADVMQRTQSSSSYATSKTEEDDVAMTPEMVQSEVLQPSVGLVRKATELEQLIVRPGDAQ